MSDRRGRSKTTKICLLSETSPVTPTDSHGKKYNSTDIGSDLRKIGASRASDPAYIDKNRTGDLPVKTPNSDARRKAIKAKSRENLQAAISKGSILATGRRNFSKDRHSAHHEESLSSEASNSSMLSYVGPIMKNIYGMRNYYNDFTTIDWAKAYVEMNWFNYELKYGTQYINEGEGKNGFIRTKKMSLLYRGYLTIGRWVLIVLIAFFASLIAYFIDKIEVVLVGFKHGYCTKNWFSSQESCCAASKVSYNHLRNSSNGYESGICPEWRFWSEKSASDMSENIPFGYVIYILLTVLLAFIACKITLTTKLKKSHAFTTKSQINPIKPADDSSMFDNFHEDDAQDVDFSDDFASYVNKGSDPTNDNPPLLYTAAGSGVPEVKTILSGFVIRRFLGTYTLIAKTIALVFSIASGMALGKEGPYVHLSTAVGNICSRFFPFIERNDLLKKQILCASASSGISLAFGSPLGGVMFILEEINHYLPGDQLFQIFFCAITSTLFLKFWNPYGTGKSVLFELSYNSDWNYTELLSFIFLGASGGIFGAFLVKFVRFWSFNYRRLKLIEANPTLDVLIVSSLTGIITFWNRFTKQASTELILDLATSCSYSVSSDDFLCPVTSNGYKNVLASLVIAIIIKIFLTFITFGLKLPSGIYIPSMVIGALYGRIVAMSIEWLKILSIESEHSRGVSIYLYKIATFIYKNGEEQNKEGLDFGIYAMVGAGAFMAGATRMNITLATILFEITSSYSYVLPIAISIAVSNWVGGLFEESSLYDALLIINDYPFMSSDSEAIDPFKRAGDILNEQDLFEDKEGDSKFSALQESSTSIRSEFVRPKAPSTHYLNLLDQVESISHDDEEKLYINISDSPYVPLSVLESKFLLLAENDLLDGCVALVQNRICVGLFFFSELEYCLDKLNEFTQKYDIEDEIYCKVFEESKYQLNENVFYPLKLNSNALNDVRKKLHRILVDEDYFSYNNSYGFESQDIIKFEQIKDELFQSTNLTSFIDYSPIFVNFDSDLSIINLIFDKIGTRVIVLLKDGHYYGIIQKKVFINFCRSKDE